MAGKSTAVFGIYSTAEQAEQGADRLIASGFTNQDISVLMADKQASRQLAHEKNTKAPEGTATGVTTGGVIGGTLGVLAGIGVLAIPGVGPLIAAGPVMAGLAGLGIGGAVGGIIGALVGVGIPEYEAKRYEGRVKDGGVLLSAHCGSSDEISRAKDILKATGAEDIASSGEKSTSTHGVNTDGVHTNRTGSTPLPTSDTDVVTNRYVVPADRTEMSPDSTFVETNRAVSPDSTLEPLPPARSVGDNVDPLDSMAPQTPTTRTKVY